MASFLKDVARYWVKVSEDELNRLKKLSSRLTVPRQGMTAKNRERLRPLDDPEKVQAFLDLSYRIRREMDKKRGSARHKAVLAQICVAILILQTAPIRLKNLAEIDIRKHLISRGDRLYLVFKPDAPGDKAPLGVSWREASSNDPAIIKSWWRRNPHALVAIDCGKSSLVVIDADRHGAIDGVALLKELMGSDLTVFGCPIVKTARDGLHLYFAQPESEKFGNRRGALPAGIDVRGQGGYVIAPGSRRINGASWELVRGSLDLCALKDTSHLPQLPEFPGHLIRKGKDVTTALAAVHEIRLQDNTPRNRDRNYAA